MGADRWLLSFSCLLFKIFCWRWCCHCSLHGYLHGAACINTSHSNAVHPRLMMGTSWNKWPFNNGTAFAVWGPLRRTYLLLLGHWLPNTVYLLLTWLLSSSLACSLRIKQTPATSSACCMQLWHCIVLGFAGLRLACNICSPSHSPTLDWFSS